MAELMSESKRFVGGTAATHGDHGLDVARVERGEIIEVTRRHRPVARLGPVRAAPVSPWPDLDARAHAVFGDRILTPGASELLAESRGER